MWRTMALVRTQKGGLIQTVVECCLQLHQLTLQCLPLQCVARRDSLIVWQDSWRPLSVPDK
jgi:hypothetical protein